MGMDAALWLRCRPRRCVPLAMRLPPTPIHTHAVAATTGPAGLVTTVHGPTFPTCTP